MLKGIREQREHFFLGDLAIQHPYLLKFFLKNSLYAYAFVLQQEQHTEHMSVISLYITVSLRRVLKISEK